MTDPFQHLGPDAAIQRSLRRVKLEDLSDAAIDLVLAQPDEGLEGLSRDTRFHLLRALSAPPGRPRDEDATRRAGMALGRLYRALPLSVSFDIAEREARADFIERLKGNPSFLNAVRDWDKLGFEARQAALFFVAGAQAEAHGLPVPSAITATDIPPEDGVELDASWNSWDDSINVNSAAGGPIDRFDTIFEAVLREGAARRQAELVRLYEQELIWPDDPRHEQAAIFYEDRFARQACGAALDDISLRSAPESRHLKAELEEVLRAFPPPPAEAGPRPARRARPDRGGP